MLTPLLALALVRAAHAQDAVSLQLVKTGQVGTADPAFQMRVNADATRLDVKLSCGGRSYAREREQAAAQAPRTTGSASRRPP